jgi:hypothetical protein
MQVTLRLLGLASSPKDLVGIPWRVAFALQADGWWLRQDIIWHKPNPMPESVTDRCTKAHEYVFLLTKSERYFYDAEAVSEAQTTSGQGGFSNKATLKSVVLGASHKPSLVNATNDGRRNRRSVWTITTKPYSGAHFAVMPPIWLSRASRPVAPSSAARRAGRATWDRVVEKHGNGIEGRPGIMKASGTPEVRTFAEEFDGRERHLIQRSS